MEQATLHSPSTVDTSGESKSAQPAESPTGAARIRIILVLGALIALGPLTIDMYLPALPALGADLDASSSAVQLTLTGTLLGLGLGQLVIGPLSDSLGRRRPLIAGTVLHIVASVLCLVAPNVMVLGVLRGLQGIGAAAAAVIAMAVVRDLFTGRAAATTLSRLMLVMGTAPILAPTIGAAVLTAGSWRGVFAVLAALGVVMLLVAIFLLRETLPVERRRTGSLRPVLATYRMLVTDPQFVVLTLVAALGMSALFSYVSGSSFVLQDTFDLSQQQFALVFALGAVALIGASQVNVVLLNRYTARQIVFGALAAGLVFGAVLIVFAASGAGGLVGFLVPLLFLLGSVGFVLPNAPALALSRHGEAAGTAAALLGATQFGLGALIAPVVGFLGNDGPAMAVTMTGGILVAWVALTASMVRQRTLATA
jgi:DHA1 family bicyclomycin/chloramphenicol resistance-like MFS transporter